MPIEVTVKTLDSNQYKFQIPDEFTVKEFKEHIANEVNVPWDKQRIIFGGKVLQDDRRLADCQVDKKTVHLVQKLPTLSSNPDSGASTSRSREGASPRQQHQHIGTIHIPLNRTPGTLIVEAMIPPEQMQPGDQIEQIIRQVINTMGSINPLGVGTHLIDSTTPGGWNQQPSQGINNRLLTIRALFRVAFNSVNILEGRPAEVYQARDGPTQQNPPRDAAAGGAAAAAAPGPNSANTTPRQPNRPFSYLTVQEIRPTRETLSRVYQEFDCLQERLAPFMTRYRELLAQPSVTADNLNEQTTRQLTSRVAMTLHAISHIQHHLSDLEIDPRRPDQITTRQSVIPMAIHGSLNVHSVAYSNAPPRDAPGRLQQPSDSRMTVGQAASQAAGQTSSTRAPTAGQQSGQAAAQGSSQEAQGAQVSTGTQTCTCGNSTRSGSAGASGGATTQPQSSSPLSQLSQLQQQAQQHVQSVFSHFDIAARLSGGALRGRSSAPSTEAPSREDTTASNTTTNTTDTPTVAGSTMNSGPQPSPATINLTSRILTQGREQFDPYLACNSVWTHFDRANSRRGTSHRSSSAPAPTRRAAEGAAAGRAANAAGRRLPSPEPAGLRDFAFRPPRNFEADLLEVFPAARTEDLVREMPLRELIIRESGEGSSGFFNGLVRLLLSELHSVDFLQVLLQERLELLNSLQTPLQRYLRENLLNGMPQTPALIEARVNEITSGWTTRLPLGISEANILPGIDIQATLVSFLRTRIVSLFEHILNSPSEDFGLTLFMQCRDTVGYACVLLALCCGDAIESVDRILDANLRTWSGVYLGPFPGEVMRRIRLNASPVSPVNEDFLRRFIVRTEQTNANTSTSMDVDQEGGTGDSGAEISSSNAAPTETRPVNGSGPPVSHEVAFGALQAAASVGDPSRTGVWRGVVPSGWAPIIAHDMQTPVMQQRPLSDAYIEGMPTKRRRLMKPTNPSRLSNVNASLQEAIQRAGVRPRTSLEALGADLERNKMKLQDSLQKTIRDRLARRLTDDKDFESDKFPYAKRMAE